MDSGGFEDQGVSKTSIIRLTQEQTKKKSKDNITSVLYILLDHNVVSLYIILRSSMYSFVVFFYVNRLFAITFNVYREKRTPYVCPCFLFGIQQASAFRICGLIEGVFISVRVKSQPNTTE